MSIKGSPIPVDNRAVCSETPLGKMDLRGAVGLYVGGANGDGAFGRLPGKKLVGGESFSHRAEQKTNLGLVQASGANETRWVPQCGSSMV
jgi:hypothetical protein